MNLDVDMLEELPDVFVIHRLLPSEGGCGALHTIPVQVRLMRGAAR